MKHYKIYYNEFIYVTEYDHLIKIFRLCLMEQTKIIYRKNNR